LLWNVPLCKSEADVAPEGATAANEAGLIPGTVQVDSTTHKT
jgi:hypothetical protein